MTLLQRPPGESVSDVCKLFALLWFAVGGASVVAGGFLWYSGKLPAVEAAYLGGGGIGTVTLGLLLAALGSITRDINIVAHNSGAHNSGVKAGDR